MQLPQVIMRKRKHPLANSNALYPLSKYDEGDVVSYQKLFTAVPL